MFDPTKYESEVEDKQGRAKHILDVAVEEKRELTPGESKEYDVLYGEIAATKRFINDAKQDELEELRARIAETPGKSEEAPFDIREKLVGLSHGESFDLGWPGRELRDWTSASATGSGMVPNSWLNDIARMRKTNSVARSMGVRVIQSDSPRLVIPVQNGHGTAAAKAEMTAYGESDASLTAKTAVAYKVTQRYDVAEEILADAQFPIATLLAEFIAMSFGVWEDTYFVSASGTGSGGDVTPSGIFAPAATASGAVASGIAVVEMLDFIYSLGRPYRKNAVLVMEDTTAGYFAKLRTTASAVESYWWQDSVAGEPPKLYGYPVFTCPAVPAYTTASAKIIAFLDPSYYYIAERSAMDVKRLALNEYSTTFAFSQRMAGVTTVQEAVKLFSTSTA